jgi:hypothetical protein
MRKRLIKKSLAGLVVGAIVGHLITLLVNYLSRGEFLICMPKLTESCGHTGAIVVQTLLSGIFGMISFGGMCIFDIEDWSLLRASTVHCMLILVSFLTAGLLLHWFSFDLIPILIMTGFIIVVYALIWLIMYAVWKVEIRQMNLLAQEYKKSADTDNN